MQISIQSRKEIKTFWKNSRRCCWWSIYCFYTQSSCRWNFYRKSRNLCKSIVGIDASQLFPYSMCQPMPTGLIRVGIWIQKRVDSHLDKTRPAALKIWSFPISNEQDQNVKLKSSLQQVDRKKLTASVLMGLFSLQHCVWSHGLLLPLLLLSRAASFSHWRGYSTWHQQEQTRCIEMTLYTRERLLGYWNVGVRLVETVQNNQYR